VSMELALDGAVSHLVKFRVVKIWPRVLTRRQSEVKKKRARAVKKLDVKP
jgi:hypothetical protein